MTDQPPVPEATPPPEKSKLLRRTVLWALLGGVFGLLPGAIIGTMIGMQVGPGDPSVVTIWAMDRALLMGVVGAVFVGGVAFLEGLFKLRQKPPS
jgi:hypothetical protein